MKINTKQVTIVIVLIALGLFITPYLHIFGGDWGTGLSINTTAWNNSFKGSYAGNGVKYLYENDVELLSSDRYIVSWQPNADSVEITAVGRFHYTPSCFCSLGSPIFLLGQYAWVVQYEDTSGHMTTIIDGRVNHVNTQYVDIDDNRTTIGGNIPNMIYYSQDDFTVGKYSPPANSWGDKTWTWYPASSSWYDMSTGQLTFNIIGNHVGAVRVYYLMEVAELQQTLTGLRWVGGNVLLSEDWAYLPTGVGKVDTLSTNSIRVDGTDTTPETGRTYTRYAYDEGSTVQFSVDAGYSGKAVGENSKGWRLAVYDGTATLRQSWDIPDDVRGKVISYTIPTGAFVPNGNNRWTVVLENTLFDQSETEIFVVDKLSKIPGTPTITLDKYQYNEGETITVKLSASPNPNGTNDIARFYTWAKYDSPSSVDYAFRAYIPAYKTGSTYSAQYSFQATKANKYIYIRAFALDSINRSSDARTTSVYIKQVYGNNEVTIIVSDTDKSPLSGVNVTIGSITKYTSSDGKAIFYLASGQYSILASKPGFNTYHGTATISSDRTIPITLTTSWLLPEMGIVEYLVIAILIALVIYGVIYFEKHRKR